MECKHCKSSWSSSLTLQNCPFCGGLLYEDEAVITIPQAMKRIISERGLDILKNKNVFISLIMDYVPGNEREKKLFRVAAQNGALEQSYDIAITQNIEQRNILIKKLIKNLEDEAFLAEDKCFQITALIMEGIDVHSEILSSPNALGDTVQKDTVREDLPSEKGAACYICGYKYKETDQKCPICMAPRKDAIGSVKPGRKSTDRNTNNEKSAQRDSSVSVPNESKTQSAANRLQRTDNTKVRYDKMGKLSITINDGTLDPSLYILEYKIHIDNQQESFLLPKIDAHSRKLIHNSDTILLPAGKHELTVKVDKISPSGIYSIGTATKKFTVAAKQTISMVVEPKKGLVPMRIIINH